MTQNRPVVWVVVHLSGLIGIAASASAATRTWTGAGGDGQWGNPQNWSDTKVPGEGDDVVIPPDSGLILMPSGNYRFASLVLQDSTSPDGTLIIARGGGIAVKTTGNIDVGLNNRIYGGTGGLSSESRDGGEVILVAGGNIANRGRIQGGNGASPTTGTGGNGGDVTVRADGDVDNSGGTVEGGAGGHSAPSLGGGVPGGHGGSVTLGAGGKILSGVGTARGGNGGGGAGGGQDGDKGKVDVKGEESFSFDLGGALSGGDVMIRSGPAGEVRMTGVGSEAITADFGVYIDTCPACPIDLSGNPPGIDVILATEMICLSGNVLLDPAVTIDMITTPDAVVAPEACAPNCAAEAVWLEQFEAYANGVSGIHGQGGWKGWDNDPAFAAPVTESFHHSAFQSLEVAGAADMVHQLCNRHSTSSSLGMAFAAWQYIPGDFASAGTDGFAGTYIVMMNTYADETPPEEGHFSAQMQFDSNDARLKVFHGDGLNTISVPYVTDRWAKIHILIDLEDDWTRVYYDDELVTEYPWTGGVLGGGGGALDIAAVDLFANGSTPVYYDDLRLTPIPGCGLSLADDADADGLDALREFRLGTDSCTPDSDDDGLSDGQEVDVTGTDPLNPDTDGDAVPDGSDLCPNTVPGATVDANGCPLPVTGDFDNDGDVDGGDVSAFETCASGPAVPLTPGCGEKDFDADADVDQSDFAVFQRCFSGEDVPADPDCEG